MISVVNMQPPPCRWFQVDSQIQVGIGEALTPPSVVQGHPAT